MRKLFLILLLIASLNIDAQFVTSFAKNVQTSQDEVVFYYLPRNVIKIEFTVEETAYYKGPYAEFATKLLGVTDFIEEDNVKFEIKSVDIQEFTETDPNAVYCISTDEKSKEPMPNVILDDNGLLLAFGYDSIPTRLYQQCNSLIDNNICQNERQDVTFINILEKEKETPDDDDEDEENGKKNVKKISKEDLANIAADNIVKIRNAYFELISGFNEVNYGNTTEYMSYNMKQLENEYISLFTGKVVKNTYKKTVYVTPEKNQSDASLNIARLNDTNGVVDTSDKGEIIKIQFDSRNSLANINLTTPEKTESLTNKLIYRIPANSDVKIVLGNSVIAQKQLPISQFGIIKSIPVKNNKILFNPNTGQVISIVR